MGDGFPKGLRPANWMGDFFEKKLDPERQKTWLVTDFIYPGSHDAATYGSGAASFSYQCQDKTLFEQMMVGQRAFDLRLAPKEGGKFQPVHGAAKGTADDFNNGPNSADDKDLAGQIMRFAKQHPTEIVILKITMDGLDTDQEKHAWAEAAWNLLGKRMLRTPQKGEDQVTYKEAVDSGKNIILAMLKKNAAKEKHDLHTYYWDVTRGDANNWLGNADQKLWNEPDWQSGNIDKVLKSTESWIDDNQNKLQKRDKFWVAMLQLTPALGQGISTFIKDGASVRPKDLALGGGIDIFGKGHFDGSNKHLRESGVLRKPIWKKHSSIILYDFADTHTTGCIVGMNLGDDDPDDVDAAKGAGGKGGGGGGRGGRGGGGDHEGGRGGRGGRGGGGGGGGGNKADDVKDKAKDLLGGLGKKF